MKRYVLFVIALIVTAIYLFPLYWMYITVFKSAAEMFQYPPTFWPQHGESHIWQVFTERGMGKFLWNSFIIACGTTAVTVFVGTGAAYALASVQNRWTGFAIFAVLVLQALPSSLMVTPIFTAFKGLGLLDTPRLAVVIAQITKTLPFYIVLCRASFVQIPRELRDAALVDGASPARAFFGVILPLAVNGILVTAILVFLQSFGEYVYARSLILDDQYQTATVGLSAFIGATKIDWIGIMTYSAVFVTPILIAFMLLQRRIVAGLTAGALK
ncbi:carbohydrate ABC transporter permease [Silvimonas iriomotensis]|uniref:ABC transporter permease n=1 Tax=Silvimonas iriomotensis TaxID=449662 RepID=A0ABQ2P9D7_9NEIS|nr:carbohydrate ABC transporter permease [Silvimonas iriomotensis]GGP21125.1 ABC transporter permease [Silvimonas iriomotensis]